MACVFSMYLSSVCINPDSFRGINSIIPPFWYFWSLVGPQRWWDISFLHPYIPIPWNDGIALNRPLPTLRAMSKFCRCASSVLPFISSPPQVVFLGKGWTWKAFWSHQNVSREVESWDLPSSFSDDTFNLFIYINLKYFSYNFSIVPPKVSLVRKLREGPHS